MLAIVAQDIDVTVSEVWLLLAAVNVTVSAVVVPSGATVVLDDTVHQMAFVQLALSKLLGLLIYWVLYCRFSGM